MELNLGSPSHAVVLKYKYIASWRYRTAFPEPNLTAERERERASLQAKLIEID